jgi:hypothetical protein
MKSLATSFIPEKVACFESYATTTAIHRHCGILFAVRLKIIRLGLSHS